MTKPSTPPCREAGEGEASGATGEVGDKEEVGEASEGRGEMRVEGVDSEEEEVSSVLTLLSDEIHIRLSVQVDLVVEGVEGAEEEILVEILVEGET